MSGVLETAAGAFAVVGVADVLVRTGRDIYNFLCDVIDAPEDFARLRDIVQETIILHQASVKCQDDLKARGATSGSGSAIYALETGSKVLGRALKSLKLLLGKLEGTKTWSRVKFALSDAQVKKAVSALEQAKLFFWQIRCELSAPGNTNIQDLLQNKFQQASVDTQGLRRSLMTILDVQHESVLTSQGQNLQVLLSKIEQSPQTASKEHNTIQTTMISVQHTQREISNRQNGIAVRMIRDQKRTSASIRKLSDTVAKAADIEDLTVPVKQSLPSTHGAQQIEAGRQVFFLGERPDQILTYLLPFLDGIDFAIDYVIAQHPEKVSKIDAEWLRLEFEHLISSSSQENALQYLTSTATPLDRWSYPGDTVAYMKRIKRRKESCGAQTRSSGSVHDDNGHKRPEWTSRKCISNAQQKWLVLTESGQVTVSLPKQRHQVETLQGTDEVGLSYRVIHNRSTLQVRARFLRNFHQTNQSQICVHLNVSVLVDVKTWLACLDLMKKGSLPEIDSALRQGIISPFHMKADGDNVLLRYAAHHNRRDVFNYLESQGIGQSALNHDSSISRGLTPRCLDEQLAEQLMHKSTYRSSFATRMILVHITCCATEPEQVAWTHVGKFLKILQEQAFSPDQNARPLGCFAQHDIFLDCIAVPRLVGLLLEADMSVLYGTFGTDMLMNWLYFDSHQSSYCEEIVIEVLSMLIRSGIDVNFVDFFGRTPSKHARERKTWVIWCGALKSCGKDIEDVVSKEGNTWLMSEDWKHI